MAIYHVIILATLASATTAQQVYACAFTAYRSASVDVTTGNNLIFDSIITNYHGDDSGKIGDPYAPSSGVFTCPVTGYYYFHYTIKSDSLSVVSAQLEHTASDGATILGIYSTASTQAGLDTASNAGSFKCNANENVRLTATAGGRLYGESDKVYSTFDGMLVYGVFS